MSHPEFGSIKGLLIEPLVEHFKGEGYTIKDDKAAIMGLGRLTIIMRHASNGDTLRIEHEALSDQAEVIRSSQADPQAQDSEIVNISDFTPQEQ